MKIFKIALPISTFVLIGILIGCPFCRAEETQVVNADSSARVSDEKVTIDEKALKDDRVKDYLDKAREFYKDKNYKLVILESYKTLLEEPDNAEAKDLIARSEHKAKQEESRRRADEVVRNKEEARKARIAAEKEEKARKESERKARLEAEKQARLQSEEARKARLAEGKRKREEDKRLRKGLKEKANKALETMRAVYKAGDYKTTIVVAEEALKIEPNNSEALSYIRKAKEKLKIKK